MITAEFVERTDGWKFEDQLDELGAKDKPEMLLALTPKREAWRQGKGSRRAPEGKGGGKGGGKKGDKKGSTDSAGGKGLGPTTKAGVPLCTKCEEEGHYKQACPPRGSILESMVRERGSRSHEFSRPSSPCRLLACTSRGRQCFVALVMSMKADMEQGEGVLEPPPTATYTPPRAGGRRWKRSKPPADVTRVSVTRRSNLRSRPSPPRCSNQSPRRI